MEVKMDEPVILLDLILGELANWLRFFTEFIYCCEKNSVKNFNL